jgi:hypothetical protein
MEQDHVVLLESQARAFIFQQCEHCDLTEDEKGRCDHSLQMGGTGWVLQWLDTNGDKKCQVLRRAIFGPQDHLLQAAAAWKCDRPGPETDLFDVAVEQ